MKILINFNNCLSNKHRNMMGGIETLNYNLISYLKKEHKIFTIYNKDKPAIFDLIISSNDAKVFNKFKSNKKILWLHNKLQIEKAIRKKQLIPILKNNINAVFVSEYLNKKTTNFYNFKTRTVIPNFLDKKFENQKIQYKRKPWIIWAVSREKGLMETINIWKCVVKLNPKMQFHIFGVKKKRNIKRLKKYNIYFHNRVSKEILIKYYKQSLASLCLGYDETFCLNAIESMSCGTPVLSFKMTALNKLIKNNINGYKVDNFEKIHKKIKFIINMSNSKRSVLINKTYSYSKKYYFNKIKSKWLQLINK